MEQQGTLSIKTENIFPIIKKYLYSDHEIFLRELVSNAVDATQKIKKLASIGEYKEELGDLKIKISVNDKAKTITVTDRGIGMTAEEIKKYINEIAFSGVTEFLEKYKKQVDKKPKSNSIGNSKSPIPDPQSETPDLIGHFGLGFYSSFMVADKVEIITKSYQKGAEAVKWSCDGSTEFNISKVVKKERGTEVVVHLAKDSEEFSEKLRVEGILQKYGKFLPVEVEFDGKVVNNTAPLWTKKPNELKDKDYLDFYKELYPFSEDPLFWIHLNVDYPFNLTGVLFFPKIRNDFELHKNKIHLYCRQVFITDEVKDVVPEFLMLLHGVLDSPDIPLNVSRSFLQSDSNVKKINAHITKKVADKLSELFKNEVDVFEKKWDDISIFVKFGMISDEKFYEKAKDFCLLKNIDNKYFTIEEYKKHIEANQKDKDKNLVCLYTTDKGKQDAYIQAARKRSFDVLNMDGSIDKHFIGFLESKSDLPAAQAGKLLLKRIDADTIDKLIDKGDKSESVLSEDEKKKLKELFEKAIDNKNATITIESLASDEAPLTITLPEFMRRMKDMAAMNAMGQITDLPDQFNAVINANHPLMQKIISAKTENKKTAIAKQACDLALLSQNMLSGADLTTFIERSVELISK
ncbi:MAG: molecular chaperone HtpG [Cytophagales bacterium]|nr:molecular chaperone HtpG [Cytophagales bacterium]